MSLNYIFKSDHYSKLFFSRIVRPGAFKFGTTSLSLPTSVLQVTFLITRLISYYSRAVVTIGL